jgi:hypothetical protein
MTLTPPCGVAGAMRVAARELEYALGRERVAHGVHHVGERGELRFERRPVVTCAKPFPS